MPLGGVPIAGRDCEFALATVRRVKVSSPRRFILLASCLRVLLRGLLLRLLEARVVPVIVDDHFGALESDEGGDLLLRLSIIALIVAAFDRRDALLPLVRRLANLLDTVQNLLQLDLHHANSVTALCDASLKLLAPLVVGRLFSCLVKLGKLVAELLLSLHHRLQLDEDRGGHVEEIVLRIQLLVVVAQASTPLAQLLNRLLHLVALIGAEADAWRSVRWALIVRVAALELEELILKLIILLIRLLQLRLVGADLALEPRDLLVGFLLSQ